MMARAGFILSIVLAGLCLPSISGPTKAELDSLARFEMLRQEPKKEMEEERLRKNLEDFLLLKRVDSVGWLKVKALRKPDRSMEDLEREQLQRKTAAMISFCAEDRFKNRAEVDSVPEMTPEERAFCKNRLKTVNPLMP